jgi:hypothetical protein
MTSNQAGYHSVNNATAFDLEDTVDAIVNLATTTDDDRTTVVHLTATNASLTAELTQANTKLTTSRTTVASLQIDIATLTPLDASHPTQTTAGPTDAKLLAPTLVKLAPDPPKATDRKQPDRTTWAAPNMENNDEVDWKEVCTHWYLFCHLLPGHF